MVRNETHTHTHRGKTKDPLEPHGHSGNGQKGGQAETGQSLQWLTWEGLDSDDCSLYVH